MRVIKRKLFFAWQFEEEESWLNEMSKQGLHLVAVNPLLLKYEFEQRKDKEYTYRLEFLDDLPSSRKGLDYLQFLSDLGVEQVGSFMRWVYLRKNKSSGQFHLHSDLSSRIKYFKRIRMLFIALSPLMFINTINLINTYLRTKSGVIFGLSGLTIIVATFFVTGILTMNSKIKNLDKNSNIWE